MLEVVAEFYAGSNQMLPSKTAIDGLQVVADDSNFAVGTGELLTGNTLALIMAMTGRTAYYDQLTGPGLSLLKQRRPAPPSQG